MGTILLDNQSKWSLLLFGNKLVQTSLETVYQLTEVNKSMNLSMLSSTQPEKIKMHLEKLRYISFQSCHWQSTISANVECVHVFCDTSDLKADLIYHLTNCSENCYKGGDGRRVCFTCYFFLFLYITAEMCQTATDRE